MSSRGRIVLNDDDFADDQPAAQAPPAPAGALAPPQAAPQPGAAPPGSLPPVARRAPVNVRDESAPGWGGGAPAGQPSAALPESVRRWAHDSRVGPILAAVIGIVCAWTLTEVLGIVHIGDDATSKSGVNAASAFWVACIGVVFAAVVFAFDRAVEGAWEEAARRAARIAIPAFAAGFVSGYIAQAVYTEMLENALESGSFDSASARFYLARIVGWAIFGLGMGVAFGAVDRTRRKAINGAIGGVVGGAAGGALFEWAARNIESVTPARLIGLLGVAVLIAVAIRTVEAARRDAWLHVLAGGMAGKEFILYHEVTRIGASPDCEIFLLKDPAVVKEHARIDERGPQRILTAAPEAVVYVNQTPVQSHALRNGDQIQIGNTVMGYAERTATPTPARAF